MDLVALDQPGHVQAELSTLLGEGRVLRSPRRRRRMIVVLHQ
jgi:hypothetical protein